MPSEEVRHFETAVSEYLTFLHELTVSMVLKNNLRGVVSSEDLARKIIKALKADGVIE